MKPLLVLLLTSLAAVAADTQPLKIIARGPWPYLPLHAPPMDRDIHQYAIRSPEELEKAAGRGGLITVPKALKVPAIDFREQMLLAVEDGSMPLVGVAGGGPPSSPATVAITDIEMTEAGKTLVISWKRVPPPKGVLLTRPLEAVLVKKFDGPVKFRRLDNKARTEPAGTAVKPTARATFPAGWPPEAPRQEWVLRSERELIDPRLEAPEPVLERMRQEARARYTKALNVPAIDFTRQMIVGVSGGVRPAGTRVEVTAVERDGKGNLTVRWRLVPPEAKPTDIEHPAAVVLVEQAPGMVRFEQQK